MVFYMVEKAAESETRKLYLIHDTRIVPMIIHGLAEKVSQPTKTREITLQLYSGNFQNPYNNTLHLFLWEYIKQLSYKRHR